MAKRLCPTCGNQAYRKSALCKYCTISYGPPGEPIARKQRKKPPTDPVKRLWNSAKSRAKVRGLSFNLELKDIVIPETCPYLGIPLQCGLSKPSDASPSIDRINNRVGYVRGNIEIISKRANTLKSDAKAYELLLIGARMRLLGLI